MTLFDLIQNLERGAMPLSQWVEASGMLELQHSIKHGAVVTLTPEGRDWLKAKRISKRMTQEEAKPVSKPKAQLTPEQHREDAIKHKEWWDQRRKSRADAPQPALPEQERKRQAPVWNGARWIRHYESAYVRTVQANAEWDRKRQAQPVKPNQPTRGPFQMPGWLPKPGDL